MILLNPDILGTGTMALVYGTILAVLGCWSAYATTRRLILRGHWRRYPVVFAIETAFTGSCFLPAVALIGGGFHAWMLAPLGACYLVLIRLPCVFAWANRAPFLGARNLLFLLLGLALLGLGIGWIPLGWVGL